MSLIIGRRVYRRLRSGGVVSVVSPGMESRRIWRGLLPCRIGSGLCVRW